MRYLTIWMHASECGEREKGELANLTYLACVSNFRTMYIFIILIVNLRPEKNEYTS